MSNAGRHDPSRTSHYVTDDFYRSLVETFTDWQDDRRMVTDAGERDLVRQFLEREARLLAQHRYDDWLGLFVPECAYWVPGTPSAGDPRNEIAVMFDDRRRLEDRVFRLQTEISLSSTPVPRTRHSVSMTMLDEVGTNEVRAFANWQVVWSNDVRGQQINAGSYHYVIRRTSGGMRIKQKKVLLLDPVIDGYFDFYAI